MIKAFFLELQNGRLTRRGYLGYSLLLVVVTLVLMETVLTVAMGTGYLLGGDATEQTKIALDNALSNPVLTLLFILFLTFTFIYFNLSSKRLRDIGLPGLLVAGTLIAAIALVDNFIWYKNGGIIASIIWLVMALTPGNLLNKG